MNGECEGEEYWPGERADEGPLYSSLHAKDSIQTAGDQLSGALLATSCDIHHSRCKYTPK